jgi:hypothetical protein
MESVRNRVMKQAAAVVVRNRARRSNQFFPSCTAGRYIASALASALAAAVAAAAST